MDLTKRTYGAHAVHTYTNNNCITDAHAHYYATVYHELAHSTGHSSRLNRITKPAAFGSEDYSREELVAEITSGMLCSFSGIDSDELLTNCAAYIQSWSKALADDCNMILYAAAKAEKAYTLILDGFAEAYKKEQLQIAWDFLSM